MPPNRPRANLEEMGDHFSSDAMIPLEWIMIAAGLVLLLIGALSTYRWWKTRHLRSSPLLVFYRVGPGLGLHWQDLWLLYRIGRRARLPTPLALMMSPRTLEVHGEQFAARSYGARRRLIRRQVARVETTLFGRPRTTGTEPDEPETEAPDRANRAS